MKKLEELTVKELKEKKSSAAKTYHDICVIFGQTSDLKDIKSEVDIHPMINKRCLIRTYSAGVHIGDVVYINPENNAEYLYQALCCLALQVDSDTIQDVFQGEMNETGYFEPDLPSFLGGPEK